MKTLIVQLEIWGRAFSPAAAAAATGVVFSDQFEPGEICESGPYKGGPRPYGAASWTLHECDLADPSTLEPLERAIEGFQTAGADRLELVCAVTKSAECSVEICPDVMALLGRLHVPVVLSWCQEP